MSGYIGTKSVTLSTTTANVGGDSTVGGDLTVDTNTLYVDSTNNRVGVGTVSPLTEIGFPIGNDIKISQAAGTDHLAGNAGSIGLTIIDGGGHSGVFVNNSHDGTYSDQFITFKTAEGGVSAATERLRILPSGGITFNGDTAAANALDDYEEGTFTPTVGLDAGSGTFSTWGSYVKIGKQVTVTIRVRVDTASSALINVIGSMPFTPETANQQQAVGTVRENAVTGHQWHLRATYNSTSFLLRRYENSQGISANYDFVGSVTYFTA